MDIPSSLIYSLKKAKRVTIMTGAGVSAESQIPTFRDAMTGLWAQYDPTELATPEAFARDPKLVWDWYQWRHQLVKDKEPNPGHFAIAECQDLFDEFTLITQNVDGLHQRAGSRNVIELHGNISRMKCTTDGTPFTEWPSEPSPPPCPTCDGLLRPDVVWFGEQLPAQALEKAQIAAVNCDVFLTVGTSGVVQPAASFVFYALSHGAVTVEINPNPTGQADGLHYQIPQPSGKAMPAILSALREVE